MTEPISELSRRRLLGIGAATLVGGALGGCGIELPGQGEAPKLFVLSPKNTFDSALPRVDWQLVVETPLASGGLESNRIPLKSTPFEIQYYANARWTEAAPQMMQSLLVESFENTGRIVAVGRQAIGLRSDYNLSSELREFQAEYASPNTPPLVRVRINAKLIRQPRREIVGSTTVEQTAAAASTSMPDVIVAFDDASGKVLRRVVEWTIRTGASPSANAG